MPQWNGNPDILGRWISKINRLANNSPDIREELGKIVPRRFTDSAETWYYSIPDAERIRLEENWTTLKKAISEYWIQAIMQEVPDSWASIINPQYSKTI